VILNFIARDIHNRLLSCTVHCPSLLSFRFHHNADYFRDKQTAFIGPLLLNPASRAATLNLYEYARHYREKMSHITPADVRCISHVGYEENIDSGTFLTPWREKKKHGVAEKADMCMRSTEWRCNDKINLLPDDKYRYWCSIWLHVSQIARQILTRLTKRMPLSMLEKSDYLSYSLDFIYLCDTSDVSLHQR